MATMPVEGPTTTTGLQVVETIWAADMGYGPSDDGSTLIFTMVDPPSGEFMWCSTYGCDLGPDVEAEVPS